MTSTCPQVHVRNYMSASTCKRKHVFQPEKSNAKERKTLKAKELFFLPHQTGETSGAPGLVLKQGPHQQSGRDALFPCFGLFGKTNKGWLHKLDKTTCTTALQRCTRRSLFSSSTLGCPGPRKGGQSLSVPWACLHACRNTQGSTRFTHKDHTARVEHLAVSSSPWGSECVNNTHFRKCALRTHFAKVVVF